APKTRAERFRISSPTGRFAAPSISQRSVPHRSRHRPRASSGCSRRNPFETRPNRRTEMAHNLSIEIEGPEQVFTENELRFEATGMEGAGWKYTWHVRDANGHDVGTFTKESGIKKVVHWKAPDKEGLLHVEVFAKKGDERHEHTEFLPVQTRPLARGDEVPVVLRGSGLEGPLSVNLRRSAIIDTPDEPLWTVIRASTDGIAFNAYHDWMDTICGGSERYRKALAPYVRNVLPFPDIVSYKALKLATEAFLLSRVGVRVAVGDVDELAEEWA